MKEPYFMQQLHKQRERASKILWSKFKGDFGKFYKWREKKLSQNLKDYGYYIQQDENGFGRLIRDKARTKYDQQK